MYLIYAISPVKNVLLNFWSAQVKFIKGAEDNGGGTGPIKFIG
jgi:hypothetical protein